MPADAIIAVSQVSKVFHVDRRAPGLLGSLRTLFSTQHTTIHAVADLSFSVAPGELVGYIGPNGAGKSTTIKMLTGVLHPSSGELRVAGVIPHLERTRHARQIGVIFGQRSQLLWDLPPRDSFDLMRRMYNIPAERYRANMALFSEILDLGALLDRPVRQLSLGQRMRCELVASLLHDPRVVFLDEPTIGLDVVAKDHIRSFIQHLNREHGVTVVLTTHDVVDIEQLCSRVLIIDKGRLIYDGGLQALKQQYGRRRRIRFSTADATPAAELAARLSAIDDKIQLSSGDDGSVVVAFDPQRVPASELTRIIVTELSVSDLSVEEANLEEIIRRIYGGGSAAA